MKLETPARRPLRILELRTATGQGGGPEKSILSSAAGADPERFAIKICYLRPEGEEVFWVRQQAEEAGLDYVEIRERSALDWRTWSRVRAITREAEIDLIHAHDYKTMLLAAWLRRLDGIVAIATAHGWTGRRLRDRWLYHPAAKRLLRGFDRVVAVSRELRDDLAAHGVAGDRLVVLLNAIDAEGYRGGESERLEARARLGLPPGVPVVGSVGRLARQKRFDLLIEAVARLAERQPELRLVLLGEGEERGRLEVRARDLGVGDRVFLAGHRGDVAELLPGFDLFVSASDFEGSANAVLEAMAAAVPLVATAVGATPDLVRDGIEALLVPPGDVAALAAAVWEALSDRVAAAERAAAARRRVEGEHSFSRRREALERIYTDLVVAAG